MEFTKEFGCKLTEKEVAAFKTVGRVLLEVGDDEQDYDEEHMAKFFKRLCTRPEKDAYFVEKILTKGDYDSYTGSLLRNLGNIFSQVPEENRRIVELKSREEMAVEIATTMPDCGNYPLKYNTCGTYK